ncbi:MAG TPA: SRPBCC domain-containing protein [Chitinophagaceae bacterium]
MTSNTTTNHPVVKEVLLDAPVSRVWRAITDKEEMKHWYFDLTGFKPEVGFEFQFYGESSGVKWLHLCKVTEAIPNKRLSYSWRYDGYPGNSLVTFELQPEGNKTKLKLTHEGLETFPANVPDFAKENFMAGWEALIGKSIRKYVEENR